MDVTYEQGQGHGLAYHFPHHSLLYGQIVNVVQIIREVREVFTNISVIEFATNLLLCVHNAMNIYLICKLQYI